MEDRLREINEELTKLFDQKARKFKLQRMLSDLREQQEERQAQARQAADLLHKESRDVEKLEGHGLKALLLSLTGDKEERLSRERREQAAAQFQHEQAQRDLEYIKQEISRVLEEQRDLDNQQIRIRALMDEKQELLVSRGGVEGARLGELDQNLAGLRAQLQEVDEAISAGRGAEAALQGICNELHDAANLGMWDMLGGGLLVTMAKHGHIDEAKNGVDEAQRALSRFRTELRDVEIENCPEIQMGDFATFADYFFDGFLSDWIVQSGIREAEDSVNRAMERVREILQRLIWTREGQEERSEALTAEREQLLSKI